MPEWNYVYMSLQFFFRQVIKSWAVLPISCSHYLDKICNLVDQTWNSYFPLNHYKNIDKKYSYMLNVVVEWYVKFLHSYFVLSLYYFSAVLSLTQLLIYTLNIDKRAIVSMLWLIHSHYKLKWFITLYLRVFPCALKIWNANIF